MSIYEYEIGQEITSKNYPYYALVQALMRQSDGYNAERLKEIFPDVWDDLYKRYNAPGGYLEGIDPPHLNPEVRLAKERVNP